jgi:hypothetical protein
MGFWCAGEPPGAAASTPGRLGYQAASDVAAAPSAGRRGKHGRRGMRGTNLYPMAASSTASNGILWYLIVFLIIGSLIVIGFRRARRLRRADRYLPDVSKMSVEMERRERQPGPGSAVMASARHRAPRGQPEAGYLGSHSSPPRQAGRPAAPLPAGVIEVAIRRGSRGTLAVEVVTSLAGEASAVARLDAASLLARRGELQQAVLVSAVATRRVLPETERCVREVGEGLFTALLGTGEVAGRYQASAALAAERGQGLRVVLRVEDPVLAGLPWEAMYDNAAGTYVCRRNELVRHIGVASAAAPLAVEPPVRILGIASSPRGLAALNVAREKSQLASALSRLCDEGMAALAWAPSATWTELQEMLLSDRWHVVHFIGHGGFDAERDEGVLALTGPDGQVDLVEASRLVDLLHQARPTPRLVVLNACSGASTGVTDLFSGTAAALVRGGVGAVAAMQYEISDPAAVAFARGFYGAIAHGRGVDEAVSSGRVSIIGLNARTLEWVTPVLYLRGNNSHLFTVSPARMPRRES